MQFNRQTIEADYFYFGVKLGVLDFNDAIAWADAVIRESDEPGGEMVELALSRPRGTDGVLEALGEIPGVRDSQAAGALLFGELRARLAAGADLQRVACYACLVARDTGQPYDTFQEFDGIDCGVGLAQSGIGPTLDAWRQALDTALQVYGCSSGGC